MEKIIETLTIPTFNIVGRSYVMEIEISKISPNAIIIDAKRTSDCIIDNNKVFCATLNLGKYLFEHDGARKLMKTYNDFINSDREIFNKLARFESPTTELIITDNEMLYDSKFQKLFFEWLMYCGISDDCLLSAEENQYFFDYEHMIDIFVFCTKIYYLFRKHKKGEVKEKLSFSVTFEYDINKNKVLSFDRAYTTLNDSVMACLLGYTIKSNLGFNLCEYCASFFFGRKNMKCCSRRCKDLKYLENKKNKTKGTKN